jgi:hypothetical protein
MNFLTNPTGMAGLADADDALVGKHLTRIESVFQQTLLPVTQAFLAVHEKGDFDVADVQGFASTPSRGLPRTPVAFLTQPEGASTATSGRSRQAQERSA